MSADYDVFIYRNGKVELRPPREIEGHSFREPVLFPCAVYVENSGEAVAPQIYTIWWDRMGPKVNNVTIWREV